VANRREFIVQFSLGAGAVVAGRRPSAQGAMVARSDAQASALGSEARCQQGSGQSRVSRIRRRSAVLRPAPCTKGKAADAAGGCPLFAGKQVAGKGMAAPTPRKPKPFRLRRARSVIRLAPRSRAPPDLVAAYLRGGRPMPVARRSVLPGVWHPACLRGSGAAAGHVQVYRPGQAASPVLIQDSRYGF